MISYKERLNPITTFIFDVDGVLTDGQVLLYNNEFVRSMNSKDAYALQNAVKHGYKIFVITGGNSEEVKNRLLDLGVTEVHLKSANKLTVYSAIKAAHNLNDEEILYMGDDIPDYPVLEKVGMACCPQDAAVEIKQIAHYQSPFFGGKGCVRDVIEQTMRLHGQWFTTEGFSW